jgi:hypothetical protein
LYGNTNGLDEYVILTFPYRSIKFKTSISLDIFIGRFTQNIFGDGVTMV